MSNNLPTIPPTITLPTPAAELDRAGRITYYHTLSREAGRVSIMAAVAAGVELHRAKAEMPHGNFQLWIKRHCSFSDRTARNYMSLAESWQRSSCGLWRSGAAGNRRAGEWRLPIEARTRRTILCLGTASLQGSRRGGRAGRPPKSRNECGTE